MALLWADRVLDTSTTTGTGNITVSGTPPAGFQTFSSIAAITVGSTFYYYICDQSDTAWEVGLGTWAGSNTFARTTVLASSNSGSLVNFTSGSLYVGLDLPASLCGNLPNATQLISGSPSYTVAASGGNYTTLAAALADIGNSFLGNGSAPTIAIADGIYTSSSAILCQSNNLRTATISGTTYSKTLSSVSTTGSVGAYSCVLTLNNTTGIYVNGYVVIGKCNFGTNPYSMAGCHLVTAVNAGANQITITNTARWGTPSGAIAGTVYFLGATLSFTNCNGIELYGGAAAINIAGGIAIVGNNGYSVVTSYIGLDAEDEAKITFSNVNGINGFNNGLQVARGATAYGSGTLGVSNCSAAGVLCDSNAAAMLGTAIISGNWNGTQAQNGGVVIQGAGDVIQGNGNDGVYANLNGHVQSNSTAVVWGNVSYGVHTATGGYLSLMSGSGISSNNWANGAIDAIKHNVSTYSVLNPPNDNNSNSALITDSNPIAQQVIYNSNGWAFHATTSSTSQTIGMAFGESNGTRRLSLVKSSTNTLQFYTYSGAKGSEVGTLRLTLDTSGDLILATGYLKHTTKTVANLTAAAAAGAGARDFVSDSTVVGSGNFGATVVGGGSYNVPVYTDGTNWYIG